MAAEWASRTSMEFITDDNGDTIAIPIILYADKTGTDAFQRYSLEPWMFRLGILRRHIRERASSWRHLCFIPDLHQQSADSKSSEHTADTCHRCLDALLAELKLLQENPPKMWVRLGNMTKYVTVHLPIAFVMGDQMSNDVVCLRRQAKVGGCRMHLSCMCSYLGMADYTKNCQWVDAELIQGLYDAHVSSKSTSSSLAKATPLENNDSFEAFPNGTSNKKIVKYHKRRAQMSYLFLTQVMTTFPVQNAFWEMCFGDNKNGIYRAAIDDMMHFSPESGFFHYVIETTYHPMTELEHLAVDLLVEKWLSRSSFRSSVRDEFFPISFTRGFTRLSLLSYAEKVGVLFATIVLVYTDEGKQLLEQVLDQQQRKYILKG
jgi:hypothetical protein